jgi:hypothetical protein
MQNNVDDELNRVQSWSLADQLKLLEGLKAIIQQSKSTKPLYDVLDFEGIARGMWDDVGGIDEFIKQEQASWDT